MSGFDDLLQQSSRALEENPFEDPFARPRSGSPDPWSSYVHQSTIVTSSAFDYGTSGFGAVSTTTQVADDASTSPTSPTVVESHAFTAPASDPLDSANLSADDEPQLTTQPMTSPGFRESIGTDPPAPPQPEAVSTEPILEPDPPRIASPTLPSITSPPASSPPMDLSSPATSSSADAEGLVEDPRSLSPPPPSSARLPQRQETLHPSAPLPFDPSSPIVSDPSRVIATPLDQPPATAFSSLALGGESFNGWDGAQSAFVNNTSIPSSAQEEDDDDDDDDDDKPLRPRPVSIPFHPLLAQLTGVLPRPPFQKRKKPG